MSVIEVRVTAKWRQSCTTCGANVPASVHAGARKAKWLDAHNKVCHAAGYSLGPATFDCMEIGIRRGDFTIHDVEFREWT